MARTAERSTYEYRRCVRSCNLNRIPIRTSTDPILTHGRRACPRYLRRLLTHDFRAENPSVLWESRSIGLWPLKWLEGVECKNEGAPLHQSRILNHFFGPAKNDPIVPRTGGLVRHSHPFSDARFSCRVLNRILGIELDQPTAAKMA